MPRTILTLCLLTLLSLAVHAEEPLPWSTLSLDTCGVRAFDQAHPTFDGRGVVIAILDSGVEMNAPGLKVTSTGAPKVIDVQDFTGEGDLVYTRAEPGPDPSSIIIRDQADRPVHCTIDPTDGGPEWYYTWFDEGKFLNSGISDIDDDGKSETIIPILLTARTTGFSGVPAMYAAFDLNQDRDFTNDTWMTDFHVNRDHLFLKRTRPEAQRPQLTIALNIFPAERRLALFFDGGGHGTHVAGIAAGYQLGGEPNFHGVAPGAQIIALKIGNNSFAGGSTTPGSKLEAFRYAARYAREHNVPVVCNLSYGIDSTYEGHSQIDQALQDLLEDNPLLVVCTSAGNSGPGLSTVGTPAAAPSAITVAALLPAETARDGRGEMHPGDAVAVFSSRGQEILKPDIITPGYATSSVPLWNRGGDLWQGTSMASPYAAGLCARLMSAASQTYEQAPTRDTVKRALMSGSNGVQMTGTADIGAGLPNLDRGWGALQQLIAWQRPDDPSALLVSTDSPLGQGSTEVAVWRGLTLPRDPQTFTISQQFPPVTDMATLETFHRRYIVTSHADWVHPVEESIYLRANQSANVNVRYDTAGLRQPGIYIGDIHVREEGHPEQVWPDAILRTIVIVPDRFDNANRATWRMQNAQPNWAMNRHFLYVPPYASAVRFRLERPQEIRQGVRMRLFLPDGESVWTSLNVERDNPRGFSEWTWSNVSGGTIELPVYHNEGETTVPYDLTAELVAIHSTPAVIEDAGGSPPRIRATLHNLLEQDHRARGTATITGELETAKAKFGGDSTQAAFTKRITLEPHHAGVKVTIRFAPEDYLHFTDMHVGIYDSSGKALARDAVGSPTSEISWTRSSKTKQSISIRIEPAFAEGWALADIGATLEIESLFQEPLTTEVRLARGGGSTIPLPPGVPVDVEAGFGEAPPGEGNTLVGTLELTDAQRDDTLLTIPLRLKR